MRVQHVIIGVVLCCGCGSPDADAPQIAPRETAPVDDEANREGELIATATNYAVDELELEREYVNRLKAHCIWGLRKHEAQVVFVDPTVLPDLAEDPIEPVYGGFPAYFEVDIDLRTGAVVRHYAESQ